MISFMKPWTNMKQKHPWACNSTCVGPDYFLPLQIKTQFDWSQGFFPFYLEHTMISLGQHLTCQGQLVISLMFGEEAAGAQGICWSAQSVVFHLQCSFALVSERNLQATLRTTAHLNHKVSDNERSTPSIQSYFYGDWLLEDLLDPLMLQWRETAVNKISLCSIAWYRKQPKDIIYLFTYWW